MSKNTTIVRNTFYLVFRTLLISLIGLFTVREVLKLLGVEAFGLFNLVFGIAALFSFINGAMVSSTQRYLAFYIGKNNDELLNDAWVISLVVHFFIGIVVSIALLISRDLILNSLLSINSDYIEVANTVYSLAIISIFITIFQAPFNALILAQERMSFYAKLSLYDVISKLFIVYFLYILAEPLLEKYTILYVVSSLIVFITYVYYCSKEFNKKIKFQYLNFNLLKEMIFYSGWNIFGNFSAVVKLQGINILLNVFFGLIINSTYAITNTVIGVVNQLINSITTAVNPQIYKSYAEEDFERNEFLISSGSKFSFFFSLIIIFPIFFNSQYLLELWLDEVPLYLIDFIGLALIVVVIDCLSGTLMTGIQATGRIKIYQIVVSISILINIPLSYLLLQYIEKPWIVYWVALVMSIVSFGLRLYFLNHLTKFNLIKYFKFVLIKIFLVFSISGLLCEIFYNFFEIEIENKILSLFFSSFLIVIIVIINIALFGLSITERQFIRNKIKGYVK